VRTLVDSGPTGYTANARSGCTWDAIGVVTMRSVGHGECYEVEVRVGDTTSDALIMAKGWYEPCELSYWDPKQQDFRPCVPLAPEVCVLCGGIRNTEAHVDAALLTGMGHFFKSASNGPRTAWDRIGEDF